MSVVPELVGPLGEVIARSDVHRGAEGEVDPAPTGPVDRQVGVTHGEDPLAAPDGDRHDRGAGLASQRRDAPHQRSHRVGVADPGLRERADRLAGLELAARAQIGVRRSQPVDLDVPHPVHEPRHDRDVPDVVAGQEPHVAAPGDGGLLDEDEVGVGRVRGGEHDGPGGRHVLGAGPADVEPEGAQGDPAEPVHAPVDRFHSHGQVSRRAGGRRSAPNAVRPSARRGRHGRGPRR